MNSFTALRRPAAWIAAHELWLFWLIVPLWLIPSRLTVLSVPLVGLGWLSRRIARRRWTARTPCDGPLLILLLTGLGGLAWSADPAASMAGWWRLFGGIAAFYAIVNGVVSARRLRQWVIALLLGCAGVALLTLFGSRWAIVRLANWSAVYDLLPGLVRDSEDGLGFHPRIMGMALATLLPIPLMLGLSRVAGRIRLASLALLVPMGGLIILTQSIQAVFGLLVALAALALWRWRWLALLLPAGGALAWWAASTVQARALGARLLSPDDPLGIALVLRLDMWRSALRMLHDLPYSGIGLDSFALVQTHAYPGYLIGREPHAHNLYLQTALDLGLPGLVALLALFGLCGTMAARGAARLDGLGRALALGVGGSLASCAASGLLDTFWTTKPAIVLWVVFGTAGAVFCQGSASGDQADPVRRMPPWARWINGLALATILLGWLLLPTGTWQRNRAVLSALKPLIAARAGSSPERVRLDAAAALLREATAADPANPDLVGLLSSLEAWRGDQAAALAAARQRVRLDQTQALERYVPPGQLRQTARRQGLKDDMARISVYNQWHTRFPERAEIASLLALATQQAGGGEQASAMALQSLERGAEPQDLVRLLLTELRRSP